MSRLRIRPDPRVAKLKAEIAGLNELVEVLKRQVEGYQDAEIAALGGVDAIKKELQNGGEKMASTAQEWERIAELEEVLPAEELFLWLVKWLPRATVEEWIDDVIHDLKADGSWPEEEEEEEEEIEDETD